MAGKKGMLIGSFIVALIAYAVYQFVFSVNTKHMDGWSTDEFREVARAFAAEVQSGRVIGSAFAVYHKNELVVELAGGYADKDAERKLMRDTHLMGISVSKSIALLLTSLLVERRKLQFSDRVSSFWPKFGQNGKENVTVEHILTHQSGLPAFPSSNLHVADLIADSGTVDSVIEQARPVAAVGGAAYYQPMTFGILLDAIFKRVDAQSRRSNELINDLNALCGTNLAVGIAPAEFWRLARLHMVFFHDLWNNLNKQLFRVIWFSIMNGGKFAIPDPQTNETVLYELDEFFHVLRDFQDFSQLNDPEIAKAPILSINVQGATRDFAKLFGLLINGNCSSVSDASIETRGKSTEAQRRMNSVFSSTLIDEVHRAKTVGDLFFHHDKAMALGGELRTSPIGTTMLCSPFYGGPVVCVDRQKDVAFAYLTNHLTPSFDFDSVSLKLIDSLYKVLSR